MMKKGILLVLFVLSLNWVHSQSLEQGIKHLELEQYERAKKIFSSLLKSDPKNAAEYNFYLGEVYYKLENTDSAKYYYLEGIKSKDNFALNYVGMGKLAYENNPSEGKRSFDKALELSKQKDSKVLSGIANFFINSSKKDIPQAIALMERAIKVDGKNPHNYLLLGDAYLEQNNGEKAKSYYDQGFKLNESLPNAYLKIGKIYVRARNYNLGLEYFNKGLAIDPKFPPLYRETGELYYKAKQYSKAIENYKKYVELTDKSYDTDFRYASFLYFNKDYKNAIEILSRLAQTNKKDPYLNRLLAYSAYETENYAKGLEHMEEFWKVAPESKQIALDYEYYGKLLSKTGKDSLAIKSYEKAIAMDTSKYELFNEIGNIYFVKKDYKNAIDAFCSKIAMGPATGQDYFTLGRTYYNDKQFKKADSAFAKLVEAYPTSPTGYFWRARANAYIDPEMKKGLAAPHYEKFIELTTDPSKYKPELIEAYRTVGAYYMTIKKDKKKADSAWKKVKELDPSNKEVVEYINKDY